HCKACWLTLRTYRMPFTKELGPTFSSFLFPPSLSSRSFLFPSLLFHFCPAITSFVLPVFCIFILESCERFKRHLSVSLLPRRYMPMLFGIMHMLQFPGIYI